MELIAEFCFLDLAFSLPHNYFQHELEVVFFLFAVQNLLKGILYFFSGRDCEIDMVLLHAEKESTSLKVELHLNDITCCRNIDVELSNVYSSVHC